MSNPLSPERAESLRDATALISAVVRMDKAGIQAIIEHCDKAETLETLAALTAMIAMEIGGLDRDGVGSMMQSLVEQVAHITTDKGVN